MNKEKASLEEQGFMRACRARIDNWTTWRKKRFCELHKQWSQLLTPAHLQYIWENRDLATVEYLDQRYYGDYVKVRSLQETVVDEQLAWSIELYRLFDDSPRCTLVFFPETGQTHWDFDNGCRKDLYPGSGDSLWKEALTDMATRIQLDRHSLPLYYA